MAAKKTGSPAPGGTTALARWDAKLAEMAKQSKKAAAAIGGGGLNFISLKGGHFSIDGAVLPDNKFRAVIVDWVLMNLIFDGKYDEENIQSPSCYAFGRTKEELAPNPENVAAPKNATCEGCECNQWGSAETGRGKACAERARLALISDRDFNDIDEAEERYLNVPVTSMAYWGGYVRELEQVYSKPPLAFITEVSIAPQAKQPGWHLEFKLIESLEDPEVFDKLMKRYESISVKITTPFPKFEPEAAAQPRSNGRAVAKPASRAVAPVAAAGKKVVSGKKTVAPRF